LRWAFVHPDAGRLKKTPQKIGEFSAHPEGLEPPTY